MQTLDIVKPAPKDALEMYSHKMNWLLSRLVSSSPFSKKIIVTDGNKTSVCKRAGERYTNSLCVDLGECSWFRHSMDSYHAYPKLSNTPEGYDD